MRQGTGTNRPKTYTQTRDHTHPRMPNKHSHPTTNNTSPNHQKGGTPTECTKLRRLIAAGKRPDPSRTRKLSLPAPMILPNPGGKVGHRRTQLKTFAPNSVGGQRHFYAKTCSAHLGARYVSRFAVAASVLS